MATKSQLKQYFETGKIPTGAQFGELIDFVQPFITDNVSNRPNQTLLFGGDTPNPIINGLRIIHYYENNGTIYNYWIFTNEAGKSNQSGISIPMFVIKRISSEEPNLSLNMPNLEYAIPTKEQLTNWVRQGYNCDTADANTLHSALTHLTFKPWSEGGGSTSPRVAYIDSQSAWDTWFNNFKAAHDKNVTNGNTSTVIEGVIIDNCTFIIESQTDINFKSGTNSILFKDCFFQFDNGEGSDINVNSSGCRFIQSYISGNCSFQNGVFETCTFGMGITINNATIYTSYITVSKLYKCNCYYSTICNVVIEGGNIRACDVLHSGLLGLVSSRSRFYDCEIKELKLRDTLGLVLCDCRISRGALNPFAGSATVIQGFIWGCDFSNMTNIPGVMKGAQCCKFKSTLLSSGVIMADLFGNKNAATNGMNTGV